MLGIFDSGLGGLTVLKEIRRLLPQYDYLYLGDTLHVPYGNRSDEAIFGLTKKACEYLFNQGCRLIIIACNTASSKSLRRLQQESLPELRKQYGDAINILGVIRPLAEQVAQLSHGRVGVIGTRATVNSDVYVVELNKINDQLQVFQQAAPLLVSLIEENWLKRPETVSILRYYLRSLKKNSVDTLILGCTHYPLLIKKIRRIMGAHCQVPHPGETVAQSLIDYLTRHPEIAGNLSRNHTIQYLVTDLNNNFQTTANNFLGEKIAIKKINI